MRNEADLYKAISLSTMALRDIARARDCDYVCESEKTRPRPCPCAKCVAQEVLDLIEDGPDNWRYVGAMADRVHTMPRERKMVTAWRDQVDDVRLAQILSERGCGAGEAADLDPPTARDWYVATSVVQWLATNVGMDVLRKAGFEYGRKSWEEDRAEIDKRRDDASKGE